MGATTEDLQALEHRARLALADRVPMGAHPGHGAQVALSMAATDWIRENGGFDRRNQGRYSLADKYADAPSFTMSPYRTAQMYASGKAGRRAVPPTKGRC